MSSKHLMPTYNRQPVSFTAGEGCWLTDDRGHRYLDALAGIAVCNLGHCHPNVTDAITKQAQTLVHTSNVYNIGLQEQLADALCNASGMEKIFFGNSGAEANEAAIKLARLHGHKKDIANPTIIVMEGAFHGRTMATLTATANAAAQAGFEPLLPGFVRAPFNDVEAIRHIIASNKSITAILLEPIQGEGGIHVPDENYLGEIRALCDEHDLLMMLDEIQTGNGRTGHYFAYQHSGILPDVLTTAKGLGNGFPIGACLTQGKASDLFGPGSHGSTYGGNPLGCAAALAVVNTLQKTVLKSVKPKGDYLQQALRESLVDSNGIREIRGKGLMVGIELNQTCTELVDICRQKGLLINVTSGSVIRLVPPLVISENEIDQLVKILAEAITEFNQQQEAS